MALERQIDLAAHVPAQRVLTKFTDETVVPVTLRECAFTPETAGLALRHIRRHANGQDDLVGLLSEILGEG
jgi:hypothetical protein